MSEDKKTYEACYLLISPDAEKEIIQVLSQHESEILYQSGLKDIELAYPIKKRNSACFGLIKFGTLPENINKIKKILALNANILRLLIVSCSEEIGKETPVESQPTEEPRQKFVPEKEQVGASTDVLTNEALEKKLEEMLK